MTAPATATTAAFRSAVAAPAQPIATYPHSTPHAAPRSSHSPKDSPGSFPVTSSAGAESDADWLLLTPRELERIAGDRLGETAFYQAELRRSSCRRSLACGCTIDAREPYRYSVAKIVGVLELVQQTECDFHMRASHRY